MLGKVEERPVLLAAGTDATSLMYALTELADRVNCLDTSRAALDFAEPVIERPASRIRSIMRGFNSEVEDKAWFYDKDYWLEYLGVLARSRVNRLNFTTGMCYNSAIGVTDGYLLFPYPFLVSVNGSEVRAEGVSDDERARNLAMLKFSQILRRASRTALSSSIDPGERDGPSRNPSGTPVPACWRKIAVSRGMAMRTCWRKTGTGMWFPAFGRARSDFF